MKRTIIRILGTVMAVFAVFNTRDAKSAANTQIVDNTIVSYTAKSGGVTAYWYRWGKKEVEVNGVVQTQSLLSSCDQFKSGNTYKCTAGMALEARCRWCLCHLGGVTHPCGSYSSCDTGLVCETSFDVSDDPLILSKDAGTVGGTVIYKFSGCVDGAYQSKTVSPCNSSASGTNTSGYSSCCTSCPRVREYYPIDAAFSLETGAGLVSGATNCASGYCYTSITGATSIAGCYAYDSGAVTIVAGSGVVLYKSYKDCVGTYTLGTGQCPYSSTVSIGASCPTSGTGTGA